MGEGEWAGEVTQGKKQQREASQCVLRTASGGGMSCGGARCGGASLEGRVVEGLVVV